MKLKKETLVGRFSVSMLIGSLIAVLFAGTAIAGGWATTEFDEPLPEFFEGGSWVIGFTILLHGDHPAAVDGAGLRFTNDESGEVMFFDAGPVGAKGHHAASVARLAAGTWTLEVEQGVLLDAGGAPTKLHFEPYAVGSVTVAARDGTAAAAPAASEPATIPPAEAGVDLRVIAVLIAVTGAVVAMASVLIRSRAGDTGPGRVEYQGDPEESVV